MAITEEPIDMETGEVLEGPGSLVSGAIAQLNASEIDRQISTARHYPRQLSKVRKEIYSLVVQDEEVAAGCMYALPRGKEKNADGRWEQKVIQGPTARFAEIVAYGWTNCRYGGRIISEDDQFITAQGVFFDLEKNMSVTVEIKRRITDKDGRRYNPDMIGMTANAALSIASRNAILKAIPKAVWKDLYEAAERTIKGTVETLTGRRQKLVDQFKPFGMTPALVCQVLGVGGISEITLDHLSILQGILTSLKDGDTTTEQLLGRTQDSAVAEKGKATLEGIKAKYKPEIAAPEAAREDVKAVAQQAQAKLDAKRKQSPSPTILNAKEIGFEGAPTNLDAEPVDKEPF